MSRNTRKPADLPPPPAGLPPELLASLPPPPPPAAEAQPFEPPADALVAASELTDALESLDVAQAECERLNQALQDVVHDLAVARSELAQLRADLSKGPAKPGSRRNYAFELANGSRQIRAGATEAEARAKLGADGETAKFKGCLS
jgi:hypothetical protein